MIANIFAAAYDVTARRNYGVSAGVLNSVGGVASAAIIFLAGVLKSSIGFSGLLQWVAGFCCLAALTLIAITSSRFAAEHGLVRENL